MLQGTGPVRSKVMYYYRHKRPLPYLHLPHRSTHNTPDMQNTYFNRSPRHKEPFATLPKERWQVAYLVSDRKRLLPNQETMDLRSYKVTYVAMVAVGNDR